MKNIVIGALCVVAILIAQPVSAFQRDDESMNNAQKAERFSDPDESMPVYLNGDGNKDDNSASTGRHYEYDPQTGTYFPTSSVSSGTATNKSATSP